MIRQIQTCFGWSGTFSALAWAVAVILCLACLRRARRERVFAVALGFALVGYGLARWNAAWVADIRLDRTDEIRAAQEAQQRALIQEERARRDAGESTVHFAEDAPGESVGSAVMKPGETEKQLAEESGAVPAYRAAGKQKRTAGKVDTASAELAQAVTKDAAAQVETVVTFKLPEYQLATHMSRINLLLASLALLGVLGVSVGDYLRRFNHPSAAYWPLPITSAWVNAVSPRPLLVSWKGASAGEVARFVQQVARKGQTFAYFGDRLKAGELSTSRLRFGRWGIWPLSLVTWGQPDLPRDWDFLFDVVWFDRYGVLVPAAEAGAALNAFVDRLADRAALRAAAVTVPHLVCDLGSGLDPDLLNRLCRRCEQTGVRLVVVDAELPGRGIGPVLTMGAAISH